MKVIVTGAAGFIGFFTAKRLLERGDTVVGVDNLNNFYDVKLKQSRLSRLQAMKNFEFLRADIADEKTVRQLFSLHKPQRVVHLAAEGGVRYSSKNPQAFAASNLHGFLNVLEGCRHFAVEHLVYASSSAVYGANTKIPFAESDSTDHPLSLYAATKKANEAMAHSYSHLYRIPTTGLRFFTVYGPWGRPDMAIFSFTRAIIARTPIDLFNFGNHRRDFTYIDDTVEGTLHALDIAATPDPRATAGSATSSAPYRIYNVGNGSPVSLQQVIAAIEENTGTKALTNLVPQQAGDVLETYADMDNFQRDFNFKFHTSIREGIEKFVRWYREYHKT